LRYSAQAESLCEVPAKRGLRSMYCKTASVSTPALRLLKAEFKNGIIAPRQRSERNMAIDVPDIIEKLANFITLTDIICLTGLMLLGSWLLRTSLGRRALADSMPRRNNMPIYLPFIPLFIWFGAVAVTISITRNVVGDLVGWRSALLENSIMFVLAAVTVVVIVLLARTSFARGLKGFGLNARTILKDSIAAFVNLLSVWPLLLLMVLITTFFGKLIWGHQYQIQQHEELELITTHPQLPLRIMIFIVAVLMAPVLEEMIFRGLFQTMIRSFLAKPWLSILISSTIFATIHSQPAHWPVLFVLAICLGYAYEKSGSLLRPIFIHALFNAIAIIAVFYQ